MASASRPILLLTNDDGFAAPGLQALAEALEPLGRVVVVAPDRERSAASHALTLDRPLRAHECAVDRFRADGTPTDCVHLGVFNLTPSATPDLVVSGINRGLNVGDDVTYSGTVAGALEGTLLGIPSIAVSTEIAAQGPTAYGPAAAVAATLAAQVLARGLPRGTLLNVNVPQGRLDGWRVTRQGKRHYRPAVDERVDPAGRPYYWIAEADMTPFDEEDGDYRAVADRCVSITPLGANLTHERSLEALAAWELPGMGARR